MLQELQKAVLKVISKLLSVIWIFFESPKMLTQALKMPG